MGNRTKAVLVLLTVAFMLALTLGGTWQVAEYVDHLKATNPEAVHAMLLGIFLGVGLGWAVSK